jgi:hypothetical protein
MATTIWEWKPIEIAGCRVMRWNEKTQGSRERLSRQPHMKTTKDFKGLTTNYLSDRLSLKSSFHRRTMGLFVMLIVLLMSPLLSPLSYGPE